VCEAVNEESFEKNGSKKLLTEKERKKIKFCG
jgi:hypothetical protein